MTILHVLLVGGALGESDLGAVAFLLATGHKVVNLQDVDRRGRVAFIFQNESNSAGEAANQYFGRASVVASDYAEAYRHAKAELLRHCQARRAGGR